MKFVLDCSITIAWCFEDEADAYSESVLTSLQNGYTAQVPPIWQLEVVNVLVLAERKKRINSVTANNFKSSLTSLPINIDPFATDRVFSTIYELARELKLTAYDAAYIELAFREKIPLATLDIALIKAAKQIHIERLTI